MVRLDKKYLQTDYKGVSSDDVVYTIHNAEGQPKYGNENLQVTVRGQMSNQTFTSRGFYKIFFNYMSVIASTHSVQVRWCWCPCPLTAHQKAGAPP